MLSNLSTFLQLDFMASLGWTKDRLWSYQASLTCSQLGLNSLYVQVNVGGAVFASGGGGGGGAAAAAAGDAAEAEEKKEEKPAEEEEEEDDDMGFSLFD